MEIKVPDIGDFDEVPVIEIHVSEGDEVEKEQPLVTLESDKATMDVPSPEAGTVKEVLVSVNDKVSEGTPIVVLEGKEGSDGGGEDDEGSEDEGEDEAPKGEGEEPEASEADSEASEEPETSPSDAESRMSRHIGDKNDSRRIEEPEGKRVVVVGSGPGGYTAAFRAADLGLEVTLVESHERIGGVCLNVGCIPSKALLHAAKVVAEAEEADDFGLKFGQPEIDLDKLRSWKEDVVGKLTGGLDGLAKKRKVTVLHGEAKFTSDHELEVGGDKVEFDHAIIAAGSRAAMLPDLPEDERIVDSTGALELPDIPDSLLVIGGGIIGLEMASVYEALGSKVTVVELTDQLIPGCDPDLVKPLAKRVSERYEAIHLSTKVASVETGDDGIKVSFEGDAPEAQKFNRVLVAVGRRANGDLLDLDAAGVEVNDRGEIAVEGDRRTNVSHIYAIGDITGAPLLAHKASHEGKVAAERIAGRDVVFEPSAIPSVAYTDPEVAWCGLTETEAEENGTEYEKAVFPWQASGRALSLGRPEGLTKLLVDPDSRQILGAGIVGPNAGDLIAEVCLAMEMGADAEDIGLTIHPHPTLSETVAFAAEMAEGTITDLYAPKKKG
ncbi:MAG: dihydrolipoyl dehydrogenase [Actinomycetota bacterium]|nr:dihydrolipoyl dehydrogenase [Actinomycetota bacterium]